jgi:hypothetical protein
VQCEQGVQQFAPEFPAHREDRRSLDDDDVPLDGLALQTKQTLRQNEVAGARNGQEFGDAFTSPRMIASSQLMSAFL